MQKVWVRHVEMKRLNTDTSLIPFRIQLFADNTKKCNRHFLHDIVLAHTELTHNHAHTYKMRNKIAVEMQNWWNLWDIFDWK